MTVSRWPPNLCMRPTSGSRTTLRITVLKEKFLSKGNEWFMGGRCGARIVRATLAVRLYYLLPHLVWQVLSSPSSRPNHSSCHRVKNEFRCTIPSFFNLDSVFDVIIYPFILKLALFCTSAEHTFKFIAGINKAGHLSNSYLWTHGHALL